MNDGYCGDGGIPGYIFGSLVPSETTKTRIPVVLAHETKHNVRFQYIKWSNEISLAEYMICEGLAENFAVKLYGEENLGPWVSKTDQEMLNEYIKPLIQDALEVQGFDNITSYMYGDEMAKLQNYIPVGMPCLLYTSIIAQAGSKKQKETQFFFSRAECAMLNKTRHENERIDLYCFSQN